MGNAVATIAPLPIINLSQERFLDEYMIDQNGTRAYTVAYPRVKSHKTAAANASRLLADAKIKAHLEFRREARKDNTNERADRVIKELERIGFVDLLDIWVQKGPGSAHPSDDPRLQLKPIEDWPEDARRAIAGIKIKNFPAKVSKDGIEISPEHDIIEIKFWGKPDALKLLGQNEGMFLADTDPDKDRGPRPLQVFIIGGQRIAV